jgi:hypothetical protein
MVFSVREIVASGMGAGLSVMGAAVSLREIGEGELDHGCDRDPVARMFETETTETPDVQESGEE